MTSTNELNVVMTALLHTHNATFSGPLEGIGVGDTEFVFYESATESAIGS